MLAVRLTDGRPVVVDVPVPDGAGVPVRVAASGICGSDLSMIDEGWPLTVTLGHEVAGWAPDGTPVAIEPLQPCGHCELCVSGAYHLCADVPFSMIGIGVDGGMAETVLVPERCLVRLPAELAIGDASLVEPLAVALHGLHLVGHRASDRVAVIGAGTIGLSAVAAVVGRGGGADVAARHDHQRLAAERLGGTVGTADGYDVVVETAGTEEALRQAVRVCRPGGTVLLLSMHWHPTSTPGVAMWLKEVRLVPSITYSTHDGTREIDEAAALLAGSPGIGGTIITHRFPLDAAAEAFAVAADRSAGAIKVVLEP